MRRLPRPPNKFLLLATLLVMLGMSAFFLFSAEKKLPPVVAALPVAAIAPPPALAADKSQLILDLFNPSDQSLHRQLDSNAITQRIEQALTVSFVLAKCDIVSADDYRDYFRALILYAQQSHLAPDAASAEARVRQIAEQAGASYSLLYSRTSCHDPQLRVLADSLDRWSKTLLTPP